MPGAKVRGVAADVSTAAGCKALAAALPEVDILINNAGIFEPKDFFDIPDEDWSRFFEVNVMSRRAAVARLHAGHAEAQLGPHRLHLLRSPALNIPTEMIHYGITKTAQLASRGASPS